MSPTKFFERRLAMKKYEAAELKIVRFSAKDVILASAEAAYEAGADSGEDDI